MTAPTTSSPRPPPPSASPDGRAVVGEFFAGTAASYDRVVRLTTFGLDAWWKRRLLAGLPRRARSVLDLACGTGIVTAKVLGRCPRARVVGVDVTPGYLAVARRRFRSSRRDVAFVLADAEDMALGERFDAVVASYLPKYVDARAFVANLVGHLAPGAFVAFHDFTYPPWTWVRRLWHFHFRNLARYGRRIWPEWDKAFDQRLETLVQHSRWPAAFRRALRRSGFVAVEAETLSLGGATVVRARWPGSRAGGEGPPGA